MRRLMGILLSLVMTMGLMPEMTMTVFAANAYSKYLVTTDANKGKSGDDLKALQVSFNGNKWYIIEDNSSSATAGTVTLLAADSSFGYSEINGSWTTSYVGSTMAQNLAAYTDGSFNDVKDVIQNKKDGGTDIGKLYLLSADEASNLPKEVLKMEFPDSETRAGYYWLRTNGGSSGPSEY